jgi:hypothetical protein
MSVGGLTATVFTLTFAGFSLVANSLGELREFELR